MVGEVVDEVAVNVPVPEQLEAMEYVPVMVKVLGTPFGGGDSTACDCALSIGDQLA